MKPEHIWMNSQHFDFSKVKRCLFVAPHPDDNEIGAGGFIRYLLDNKREVYTLVVTDGRLGGISEKESPEVIVPIRSAELQAAVAVLGVTGCEQLSLPDGLPVTDEQLIAAVTEAIRRIKPDLVVTVDPHMRYECHPDHIRVGKAVSTAVILSGLPYYPEKGGPHECHHCMGIGYYFTDKPTHALDISEYLDIKQKSLECYESQLDKKNIDVILAYSEGQAGLPYAETFCLLDTSMLHCLVPRWDSNIAVLPKRLAE